MSESDIYALLNERNKILDEDYFDPRASDIEHTIRSAIQENFETYSVDFIIESHTKLGRAPSLLYDDNGQFAISEEVSPGTADDGEEAWIFMVEPRAWKRTIRDALREWIFA